MDQIGYGLKTRTRSTMGDAETRVRAALAAEGFGVLTEIDVAATLKTKLGIDRARYLILGACNPQLANEALQSEPDVGLLLPCNVIVYEDGTETVVAILDPGTMVGLTGNDELQAVASEARARLQRVLDAVTDRGGPQ
jgi:uncharacterized protein (DUF302 family)